MSTASHNLVYVYYHGSVTKQLMGRLLLKDRQLVFEYDSAFIKTGLELSPFKLPSKAGVSKLQMTNIEKTLVAIRENMTK